jgi:hypothetical protein
LELLLKIPLTALVGVINYERPNKCVLVNQEKIDQRQRFEKKKELVDLNLLVLVQVRKIVKLHANQTSEKNVAITGAQIVQRKGLIANNLRKMQLLARTAWLKRCAPRFLPRS